MELITHRPISILLVEDYALIRAGMRALIETLPDVEVVAEARNGREALDLFGDHQPDIVLMDLALPLVDGREATAAITNNHPNTRVIILSMHTSQEDVVRAIHAGAAGFLPKFAGDDELKIAIEAVINGRTYLSPHVSHHLAAYIRNEDEESSKNPLTPRQEEILTLIANGRSTKEIAAQLSISIKTAETHRANIMERLGIRDVAGLVKYALKQGLVEN